MKEKMKMHAVGSVSSIQCDCRFAYKLHQTILLLYFLHI